MSQRKNFDEAWQELEQLVADIEDENLPLEQLADKVKAARQLINYCQHQLKQIEDSLQDNDAPH